MFSKSTVVRLMKIRSWSKPGIYHVVLHSNTNKELTTAVVCFRFSCRLKSQHALKVPGGILLLNENISQRNQPIRVGFMYANPNVIGRAKTKDCRMIPGHSSPPLSRPCLSARFSSTSMLECPPGY